MVEFVGVVLNETTAKRLKADPVKNMDVNINIRGFEAKGTNMFIDFIYTMNYQPAVGYLIFKGQVLARDTPSAISKYQAEWKKTKMLSMEFTKPLLNLINLSSGLNGVFVTRAINMPPPMVPPQISVGEPKRVESSSMKKRK